MDEKQLIELLSDLPRTGASDGFTERTLARIDAAPRETSNARRFAAAAAIALAVLSGAIGHHEWRERQRAEALREEHRRIAAELQQLKEEASEYQPVVYLGGDEKADYVLDLRTPPAANSAARTTRNTIH